jgi:ABC-type polysaccharide/polyol phosphate export permease
VLGFFWSLVNPLMLLVVYSFVFNTIFKSRDDHVTAYGPYALFLATGVIPWTWLQTSWLEGTQSLLANAGLIRKATFPAELLPVVAVLTNLVQLALALPMVLLAFLVTGWSGQSTQLGPAAAWVPLIVLLQLPQVAGLALGFAALNVHFKDVKDILANLTTLLFFLTPILYSLKALESLPWVQRVVAANPFSPFFRAYQEAFFYGRTPAPALWLAMAAASAITFWLGAKLFDRLSETLVEAV